MKRFKGFMEKMPKTWLHEAKRLRYRRLIRHGQFISRELEYSRLKEIIGAGEVVLDIGANVGHYTLLFSRLTGNQGRVIAFEPVLSTFDLLSSNVQAAKCNNVTLINTAITDRAEEIGFTTPNNNFYQSHYSDQGESRVLSYPLSRFALTERTPGFIKIDAEGCDLTILKNSLPCIAQARPVVMAEVSSFELHKVALKLKEYQVVTLKSSHNAFLVPKEKQQIFGSEYFRFNQGVRSVDEDTACD